MDAINIFLQRPKDHVQTMLMFTGTLKRTGNLVENVRTRTRAGINIKLKVHFRIFIPFFDELLKTGND